MAKVVYCKETVVDQIKQQLQQVDRMYGGMPIISVPDEMLKAFKTKEGKPADMVIIDDSLFKIQMPPFRFDEIGKGDDDGREDKTK